jgi:hypothetical protein
MKMKGCVLIGSFYIMQRGGIYNCKLKDLMQKILVINGVITLSLWGLSPSWNIFFSRNG